MDTRRLFSYEERKQILEKSNGKCSHCGVDVSGYFTVDHVIPLSKGGSNDLSNLVALCESCNREKDNLIIHPSDYFNYLNKSAMNDLLRNQNKYYEDFDWLNMQSFLPEDKKEISVAYSISSADVIGSIIFGGSKKRQRSRTASIKLLITKTTADEVDEVIEFGLKYLVKSYCDLRPNTKESYKKEIRDAFNEIYRTCFSKGAIYCIRNKDYTLKGIVPVLFEDYCDNCLIETKSYRNGVVPTFVFPVLEKDNPNFGLALARVYAYLLSSLCKELGEPIYFIYASLGLQFACSVASACLFTYLDKLYEEGYRDGKSTSIGVWSRTDDSVLDGVSADGFIGGRTLSDYERARKPIKREHKDISCAYLLNADDFDEFMRETRLFSRRLADKFSIRTVIPATQNEVKVAKTAYDDSVEVAIEDLWVSNGVVKQPLHKVTQMQIKNGTIRPLRITKENRVCDGDAQVFLHLRDMGYKSVKCYYKKSKNK